MVALYITLLNLSYRGEHLWQLSFNLRNLRNLRIYSLFLIAQVEFILQLSLICEICVICGYILYLIKVRDFMIIFIKQILVICSMLTFLAANSYSAALKIAPDSINITSNQPFTMNINIEDVADLYGASLDLVFDSSKLMVVKVEEGDFLKQAAASTSFLNKIDNEQGRVIIGMSRLGQVSGVNGTGTLVVAVAQNAVQFVVLSSDRFRNSSGLVSLTYETGTTGFVQAFYLPK